MRVTEIVRQRWVIRSLILATAIFFVTLIAGTLTGRSIAEELITQFGGVLAPLASTGSLSILLLLVVFINNAIKALVLILLGVLLGLPPVLFVAVNGFVLGGLGSALESVKGWGYVLASFAPHGVIEVPAILLAAALGLSLGMESFKWLAKREPSEITVVE